MSGVYKLEISESEEELKEILGKQKTPSDKERIQVLYLLKSKQAETVQIAAQLVGRNRVTVQEWLKEYRKEGISGILRHKPRVGRKPKIPDWAQQELQQELQKQSQQGQGFNSYEEIRQWLQEKLGIETSYKNVHDLVHYRMNAKPKVAHPSSDSQKPEQCQKMPEKL
jgi:transposase